MDPVSETRGTQGSYLNLEEQPRRWNKVQGSAAALLMSFYIDSWLFSVFAAFELPPLPPPQPITGNILRRDLMYTSVHTF